MPKKTSSGKKPGKPSGKTKETPVKLKLLLGGSFEQKFKQAEMKRKTSSQKTAEKQRENRSAKYRALYERNGEEAIGEYLFLHPEGLCEAWVQNTLINLLEKRSMLEAFLSSNPKLWAKNPSEIQKKSHDEISEINQRLKIALGMHHGKRKPQSGEYLLKLIKHRIDDLIRRDKISVDKALELITKRIPKGLPFSYTKLKRLYSQARREGN